MTGWPRVAATVGVVAAVALVMAGCHTNATAPAFSPESTATKCPAGWTCTPGTAQCDPHWVCGTCPDGAWSYLNDGSEVAREAQTDPKLAIFNTWDSCGTGTTTVEAPTMGVLP